jgi:tetratricopeptide (TPR) repeat protein
MFSDERNARIDHYKTLDLSGLLALEAENPDDVDLLVHIAGQYFKSQDFGKSCDYYVRALKLDPYDGWSHLYFGNLLSGLRCYDDALKHFKYAADFLPDVACPQWCLGDAYRKQGDFDNADSHYRKAVEIDPDDTKAKQKLDEWLANKPG